MKSGITDKNEASEDAFGTISQFPEIKHQRAILPESSLRNHAEEEVNINLHDFQEEDTDCEPTEAQHPRLVYEHNLRQHQLCQQQMRLHALKRDCLLHPVSQVTTESKSYLEDTSRPKTHTVCTDRNMSTSMEADPNGTELKEIKSSKNIATGNDDPSSGRDTSDVGKSNDDLLGRIALLEQENQVLKRTQPGIFRFEKLYFLPAQNNKPGTNAERMVGYLDEPSWVRLPSGHPVLRCNLPVNDVDGFLRQRPDISFAVAYYYTPSVQEAEVEKAILAGNALPRSVPTSEFITLHDTNLTAAVEQFLAMQPTFSNDFPDLNIRVSIPAPYLFWYHYRSANALDRLNPKSREIMEFLTSWIEENYSQKYALVENHLENGAISQETMPFLVKPGDVLVWEERREIYAAIAKNWLKQTSAPFLRQSNKEKNLNWSKTGNLLNKISTTWSVDSWHFEFDGEFRREKTTIGMILEVDEADEESRIDKLKVYPLRFASSRIKACLERRGRTFWKCRKQQLVSFEDEDAEDTNGERFMVDYKTYQQLHPSSATATARFPLPQTNRGADDAEKLSSEAMEDDTPPPSPDIYVFPNAIPGYNLHTKKWVDLKVDRIRDVTWNKDSFKHLVVEPNTKELIQALVKNQIASEQGTDIVNRKGNGLIILLHGGPGTGKTFTAESVAELAEKPLFRVTCGDIGTKPEEVLYLGKIWNCIVLIDEAEVFLEQRSLDNLERNALVSVFLRVLEYYEGILILTSNRVGTFDEAFKSRILLSLHYDNLSEGQRTQIWKNMLRRLEDISNKDDSAATEMEPGSRKRKARDGTDTLGIDFDEVNCYITELAKQDLNGRQIRNVITTARQLATFRNTKMRYEHLQHVMSVSSKFDNYLKKLQEGYSDDQIARDEGFR
ncbi:hypothetical protein PG985_009504 [Apiospora marii]|uniref:uncharacterized protein n=1 Tax=Apiospora marii TaxID=335849 RepID=UPI00312F4016